MDWLAALLGAVGLGGGAVVARRWSRASGVPAGAWTPPGGVVETYPTQTLWLETPDGMVQHEIAIHQAQRPAVYRYGGVTYHATGERRHKGYIYRAS